MTDAGPVTIERFEPHVGRDFRGTAGRAAIALTLIEARRLPEHREAARPPFALLFRAPRDCGLGQGMLRLERDGFGGLDLFVVPVGGDADGPLFEAVFN